jgi:hypothetical protein
VVVRHAVHAAVERLQAQRQAGAANLVTRRLLDDAAVQLPGSVPPRCASRLFEKKMHPGVTG